MKKDNLRRFRLAIVLLLASIFLASCMPKQDIVEYKITGTASLVDVTLNNATGGTEQYSDVAVPHTYYYSDFIDWFLYISAQNQGDTGSVTVSIYLNGDLFKSSTSSGAYVIATASGSK
jgi:hypothetical protein